MTFELDAERLMLVINSLWDIIWLCTGVVTLGAAVLGVCYFGGYFSVQLVCRIYDKLRRKQ